MGAGPSAKPLHVVIAGGGIGGLTAALALAQAGLRVTALERAPGFEEVGAGLQLAPNAVRRLRALGLMPALERPSLRPELVRIRGAGDSAEIARIPLGPIAELRWGAPYLVIHRADLLGVLVAACKAHPAIDIMTGTEVVGFAATAGGVEVAARRGAETLRIAADCVIAADGVRSRLRERFGLGFADRPVWSGRTAWRALVPAAQAPDFARKLETGLWLGPRAHLVHYPLRQGDSINVVAISEDAWRADDAPDIWSISGDLTALSPAFARWSPDARGLIAAAPEWRRWPLFDRAPASRWTVPRVGLLGDAAHPMLPFLGQGAGQAIEDASALAAAFQGHPGDVAAALAAYQAARAARAAAVVVASRRQGAIYHLRGPMALARNLVMKRHSANQMLSRLDWLYGE